VEMEVEIEVSTTSAAAVTFDILSKAQVMCSLHVRKPHTARSTFDGGGPTPGTARGLRRGR